LRNFGWQSEKSSDIVDTLRVDMFSSLSSNNNGQAHQENVIRVVLKVDPATGYVDRCEKLYFPFREKLKPSGISFIDSQNFLNPEN
jgi:hypothetical protein